MKTHNKFIKDTLRYHNRINGLYLVVLVLLNSCEVNSITIPTNTPTTLSPLPTLVNTPTTLSLLPTLANTPTTLPPLPTLATWVPPPQDTIVIDVNLNSSGTFLPGGYEDINRLIIPAIYAELARRDATGYYFPYLAEVLPTLKNGLARFNGQGEDQYFEVEFKLRDGLTWQDGEELTSYDLVFSWEYVMSPDWPMEHYGNSGLAAEVYVQSVEAITPDRIIYRFMSQSQARQAAKMGGRLQNPSLYLELTKQQGPFVPLDFVEVGRNVFPEHLLRNIYPDEIIDSDFAHHPIYAGAYRLVEGGWDNQPVVIEAFENFALGVPAISKVVFGPGLYSPIDSIYWESPGALAEAIGAGAVQAQIGRPSVNIRKGENPHEYDWLASQGIAKVDWTPLMAFAILDFNLSNPHLADLKVRQAIAHAIDRQALINIALAGHGRLLRSYIFPGHFLYAGDDLLPDYIFDPGRSRTLLKEAGYDLSQFPALHPNRGYFTLKLASMDVAPYPRQGIATLIQQELAEVGIKVDIQFYSWLEFEAEDCSGIRNSRQFDLGLAGFRGGSLYPIWFVEHVTASWNIPTTESGCPIDMANWTGLRNARIDEIIPMLKNGRMALESPVEYTNLWHEHQILYANELTSIPLFFQLRPVVVANRLVGIQPSQFFLEGVQDTWNIFMWNYKKSP